MHLYYQFQISEDILRFSQCSDEFCLMDDERSRKFQAYQVLIELKMNGKAFVF